MTITLDKTWAVSQYHANLATYSTESALGKYLIWAVKAALIDAGFTVTYSSAATAGTVGAGDFWTTSANVVAANAGTAHSWCVLQKTSWHATAALCLDMSPAGTSYYTLTMVFAENGFNADGTHLNRPTAVSTSISSGNVYFRTLAYSTSTTYGASVTSLFSSDGACVRLYMNWNGENADGMTNAGNLAFVFDVPKYAVSWWPSPWVFGMLVDIGGGANSAGLSYANLTSLSRNNLLTYIGGNPVYLRCGTLGVNAWINRMAGFGMDWAGGAIMPPIYYISESTSYPGIMGIMYDAYPAVLHHSQGTRYKTVGNDRGLIKVGALTFGCPYGPIGM
jgi:hypothetical protein